MYLYLYLRDLFAQEEGQDVIEYVLLLGLISIIAVAAIQAAGVNVLAVWDATTAALAAALGG
jgi:Flp pilus assembly pilin Flp